MCVSGFKDVCLMFSDFTVGGSVAINTVEMKNGEEVCHGDYSKWSNLLSCC